MPLSIVSKTPLQSSSRRPPQITHDLDSSYYLVRTRDEWIHKFPLFPDVITTTNKDMFNFLA